MKKKFKKLISIALIFTFIFSIFVNTTASAESKEYEVYSEKNQDETLNDLFYMREKGSSDKGEVVYCFNERYYQPTEEYPTPSPYFKKIYDGSQSNDFLDKETADKRKYEGKELYNMIIRVLALGYPNNYANIQQNLNLSDDDFRAATQKAIWYLTDGFKEEGATENLIKDGVKQARDILLDSSKYQEKVPAKSSLSVYEYKGEGIDGIPFQNFLSADFEKDNSFKIEISKQNLDNKEIAGANLEIKDSTGKVVANWDSIEDNIKILLLEKGEYIFNELLAPDGLQTVSNLKFKIGDNGNIEILEKGVNQDNTEANIEVLNNKIIVKDIPNIKTTKVNFSKKALTEDGKELAGAEIELVKKDGEVVESWTSTGEVKTFDLKDGEYIFKEKTAPKGYELATDISFTVKDGKVTVGDTVVTGNTVVMVDKLKDNPVPEEPNTTKVNFSKKALTEDGKELAGAEIELVKKDGEVVKSWTSTGEVKTFDLEDGEYIFKEKAAPEGYELATDISFTVKDGKVTVGDTVATGNTVVMVDKLKVTEGNNDNNDFTTKKYNSYRPSSLRKLPKTGYNAFPYEVIMLLTGTFLVLNKNKKNK